MAVTAPKVFRPHPVVLNRTGLPLPVMILSGTPMTPQTRLSAAYFVSVSMQRTATKKALFLTKKRGGVQKALFIRIESFGKL